MGRYKKKRLGNGTKNNPQNRINNYQTISKNILKNLVFIMNIEKENRHIEGTHEYVEGKSIIAQPLTYIQCFIKENKSKIKMRSQNKGTLVFDRIIGYKVDPTTRKKIPTNKATIHFSRTGYHVVPTNPDKKGDK